ncbi:serine hydrolase domain-containing protein [Kitasatospora sp. NPDC056531]|uniref:serine hydrolase domain-containing protein n=1 Tax=Kitasatospora sp. NPDC056531 TaxID=3345856 RepID=UPI0036CC5BA6
MADPAGAGSGTPSSRRADATSTRRVPRASPSAPISAAQTSRARTTWTGYGAGRSATAGSAAKGTSGMLTNAPHQANSTPAYVEPRSSGRIPLIMIINYDLAAQHRHPPIGGALSPAIPRCASRPPEARIVSEQLAGDRSDLPSFHGDPEGIGSCTGKTGRLPDGTAAGTKFAYSSTNYVLAGLIVQKVTGRPLAEEIEQRVIKRVGLRHTSFPAPGDRAIRGPHPHGYQQDSVGAPLREFTDIDPSAGWAAGQMISTNSDLNQFLTALLAGRLLPPAQLAQMRGTVPIGDTGAGYGLGLISRPLSCGGVYWGHGGDIPGYETRGGATDDGRAVNVAVTGIPADPAVTTHIESLVDTALCR